MWPCFIAVPTRDELCAKEELQANSKAMIRADTSLTIYFNQDTT